MSRKAAPTDPLLAHPKGWPSTPFLMNDVASVVGVRILVLERSVGAWRGVRYSVPYGYVVDDVLLDNNCALTGVRGIRYYPWEHNDSARVHADKDFKTHCEAMRTTALQNGATPEAIRLLHGYVQPFTEEEVKTMAGKLTTKAAPAPKAEKAPKAAKADKATPAKKAGNPEALAKAREAADGKRAIENAKKLTIATEKKANPYREGTKAYATFELMKQHKTVGDFRAACTDDHDAGYLRYAARDGHITIG